MKRLALFLALLPINGFALSVDGPCVSGVRYEDLKAIEVQLAPRAIIDPSQTDDKAMLVSNETGQALEGARVAENRYHFSEVPDGSWYLQCKHCCGTSGNGADRLASK